MNLTRVKKIEIFIKEFQVIANSYSIKLAIYNLLYNISGYLKLNRVKFWAFNKKSIYINEFLK